MADGDRVTPAPPVRAVPKAPTKLKGPGRTLWRTMVERFDFERVELVVLEQACRQRDDLADLEALVRDEGMTVKGSTGQTRLHPAVTEARLARATLARLLGELSLPEEEQPAGGPDISRTSKQKKATRAATRRWELDRQRREGRAR